jgi:hypothetical protein
MAWGKAGSDTLTSAGDTITVSGMTSSETNQYMSHGIASGVLSSRMRLGDGSVDTGSNYADRVSNNGTGDSTQINETDIHILNGFSGEDHFTVGYFINIATEEKLHIGFAVGTTATGSGSAPQRMEIASKWANTSVQFDNIQSSNVGSGSFDTDSNLSALGSDITPASAVTFPTNVQEGSRAEITDSRKMYSFNTQYNKTNSTGTERKTGWSNYYRLTTKFLTGHAMIGKTINSITIRTRSVGTSGSSPVLIGVWGDSGGTITQEISPIVSNRVTDGRFTVNGSTIEELTFSFASPYTVVANDHIGIQFGLAGNSSNYMVLESDTSSPETNTETYFWTNDTTKGSTQTATFAIKFDTQSWQEIGA